MRILLSLIFFLALSSSCLSQDVIVLRSNESEIRCGIIALNDSIISYRLWRSPDSSVHTLRRHEVLSFMLDKKNETMQQAYQAEWNSPDRELLGKYLSGTTAKGYIVSNNSDTMHGKISINNVALNQLEVHFTNAYGKDSLYAPGSLKGYGYGNVHYESITAYRKKVTNGRRLKDGKLFLHREVNGNARVYRLFTLFFPSNIIAGNPKPPFYLGRLKEYFIIVGPSGQSSTKGRSLRGALLKAINDPRLGEQLSTTPLRQIDVPSVVKSYNENQLLP